MILFDESIRQRKSRRTTKKESRPAFQRFSPVHTVAPLGPRNNDCSDDDKRLVTRYSAICRRETTLQHPCWYSRSVCVPRTCNLATNNETKQHHRPTKEGTTWNPAARYKCADMPGYRVTRAKGKGPEGVKRAPRERRRLSFRPFTTMCISSIFIFLLSKLLFLN